MFVTVLVSVPIADTSVTFDDTFRCTMAALRGKIVVASPLLNISASTYLLCFYKKLCT